MPFEKGNRLWKMRKNHIYVPFSKGNALWKLRKSNGMNNPRTVAKRKETYFQDGSACRASARMKENNPMFREEILEKMRQSRIGQNKGPKHWAWRGGSYQAYQTYGLEWHEWLNLRKSIFERDCYKCSACDSDILLDSHHIIPYRISHDNSKENLLTFCRKCHASIDNQWREIEDEII